MCFRKAILIIHGFAGGTYDQEYLANYLEFERKFDVFSFTLPGHEPSTRGKATKEDWLKSSEEHIQTLIDHKYRTIYVVGHSMGGVIATYLATKHKEVKKIVLAAPAFRYLKSKDGSLNLVEALKATPSLIKTYSKDEVFLRAIKLPLKMVNEFTSFVKKSQELPNYITIPTLIIQGLSDLVVPIESSKYVYDTIKSKKKKMLFFKNTTHDIFRGSEKDEICEEIKKFLK